MSAALLAASLLASPASAQEPPEDDDELVFEEDEIVFDEDQAAGDEGGDSAGEDEEEVMEFGAERVLRPGEIPTGASENPTPLREFDAPPESDPNQGQTGPVGYPIALALRPQTLLAGMAEFGLDAPLFVSPAGVTTALRVRYGVIDEVELGLRYGIVGVDEDVTETGRAVAIDALVKLTDWASAQLTLPIMIDPFAMAITVGAPLRFEFGRSFTLFFGRDLVTVRVTNFIPVVVDPRVDARNADVDQNSNTIVSRGDLRFIGGAIYQLEPNLAITGDIGVVTPDLGSEPFHLPIGAAATWTPIDFIDLAGRVGFGDLGDGGSFGLTVSMALRL